MDYKEYLTIISVPEQIDKKINLFKRSCGKHIGQYPGMYAKAHISFDIIRDQVDQITKKPITLKPFYDLISLRIRAIPPRELKITGFDFFVHGPNFRTIYAALELDDETTQWFHSIKQTLRINKRLRPHITITRNIPTASFNILWPYFQKMEYQDSFMADHLTILEKESNLFNCFKVYKKLPFAKKPSAA